MNRNIVGLVLQNGTENFCYFIAIWYRMCSHLWFTSCCAILCSQSCRNVYWRALTFCSICGCSIDEQYQRTWVVCDPIFMAGRCEKFWNSQNCSCNKGDVHFRHLWTAAWLAVKDLTDQWIQDTWMTTTAELASVMEWIIAVMTGLKLSQHILFWWNQESF
jgi:hypothetical protein